MQCARAFTALDAVTPGPDRGRPASSDQEIRRQIIIDHLGLRDHDLTVPKRP